jgi:hypothetical protein
LLLLLLAALVAEHSSSPARTRLGERLTVDTHGRVEAPRTRHIAQCERLGDRD